MKSLLMPMSWMVLPGLSSRVFIVLDFTIKVLFHLELIFIYYVRKGSSFNLLHITSSYPSSIYWIRNPFPIACFYQVYQRSDSLMYVVLFLVLFSVPLVYVSVFRPVPCCFGNCSIVWSQGSWCLQLCSFCLRLPWLFRLLFDSMQILSTFF